MQCDSPQNKSPLTATRKKTVTQLTDRCASVGPPERIFRTLVSRYPTEDRCARGDAAVATQQQPAYSTFPSNLYRLPCCSTPFSLLTVQSIS